MSWDYTDMAHVPVMVEEVLKFLDPKPNQNFVDCTLGDGGHARAILERTAPNGKLLGIDADAEAILGIRDQGLGARLIAVQGNFRNLAAIVQEQKFGPVHGILLDLGFSSSTLERGRGFSFEKDELLDMRFDTGSGIRPVRDRTRTASAISNGIRAAEIVNSWNQKQLSELLEEYGEERLAWQIADRIVAERKKKPVVTTKQLADVVVEVYREKLHSIKEIPWIGGIHPATRTFQALRIAVNDELNALQEVLPQAVAVLAPGGRLAVMAFHSLEDRIVKQFFRDWPDTQLKVLTKKPVVANDEEIKNNPRARSAKLRVVEKYA